jgi:phytol kinase
MHSRGYLTEARTFMVQYGATGTRTTIVAYRPVKESSLTQRDLIGVLLSYVYAFGLLFVVEGVGRWRKWPQHLTRKLVHIGAGMWIWALLLLFDSWKIGLIPFASFIVLNYLFYRFQLFKTMDATDSSPGTVYFAISITLLFALLWRNRGPIDRVPVAAAAVMAMTWGDGLASIVGERAGRHGYTVFGHRRSWEGTATMGLTSCVVIAATLLLLSGSHLSSWSAPLQVGEALLMALIGALVATTAEGLSPAGTDNLTVPLLSGFVLALFTL